MRQKIGRRTFIIGNEYPPSTFETRSTCIREDEKYCTSLKIILIIDEAITLFLPTGNRNVAKRIDSTIISTTFATGSSDLVTLFHMT